MSILREEYLRQLFDAYNEGRISAEAYDIAVMNADKFCSEEDKDYE